jgi:Fe-S oxidoreductase
MAGFTNGDAPGTPRARILGHMNPEDATAQTERCFRGEPASCSCACPFHMDVRSLLEKMSQGRWTAAYRALRDATVFPAIVSALCDEPCGGRCQRGLLGDEAIAMRDLEAACLRHVSVRKAETYVIPPKEQRVAVVGAGTAGLACALSLAQKKYRVTVFEKEGGWGGTLRSHPRFAEFDEDIALQFAAVETEFRYGAAIKTLDEAADFDAVFVATGDGGESFGLLASWDRELCATSESRVFMGGALVGATLMEGIAQAVQASGIIETFLQTGRATRARDEYEKGDCGRELRHDGAVSAPRVAASGPDGYTEKEAREEAARCLQCDCDKCLVVCEMLKRFRKDPRNIALEVHTDMALSAFSSRTVTREVYSCNICGYCASVCPEKVDVGALLHSSRAARMSAGIHPAALHDHWLREMDFATSEGSLVSAPPGEETCEYAFYPGCQLGASNPQHVLRSYETLCETRDAGIFLGCCGAPAFWAGDEARLRANNEAIRQGWRDMGKPTLIFACATCESLFGLFLPEIQRVSLYELLAGSEEIVVPTSPFAEAAVFDPCAARDNDGMQTGVRTIAGRAGVTLEELRERNRCCGHGGHMRIANPSLYDEIAQHRAETSARPYVVYCANCREVFASQGKQCAHILDLVFGLNADSRVPSLQEKRDNSLSVKRQLMKRNRDVDYRPEPHAWDSLTLIISDDLQARMDKKLISAADVKEAIWLAESSGDRFYDESDGMRICSMLKPAVIYWVQYRETAPLTYEVVSAYYHRMRFDGAEPVP